MTAMKVGWEVDPAVVVDTEFGAVTCVACLLKEAVSGGGVIAFFGAVTGTKSVL